MMKVSKKSLIIVGIVTIVLCFGYCVYLNYSETKKLNKEITLSMDHYNLDNFNELKDKIECYNDFVSDFNFLDSNDSYKGKKIYSETKEKFEEKSNEMKDKISVEITSIMNKENVDKTIDSLDNFRSSLLTLNETLKGTYFEKEFTETIDNTIKTCNEERESLEIQENYNELKTKINSNIVDNNVDKATLLEKVSNLTSITDEIKSVNLSEENRNELVNSSQSLINDYNAKIKTIEEEESISEAESIKAEEESRKQAEAEGIRKAEEESRKLAEVAKETTTKKVVTTEKVTTKKVETTTVVKETINNVKEEVTTEQRTENPNAWKDSVLDLKYNADGTANLKDSIIGTPDGIGMETSVWRKEITNFFKHIDNEELQNILHSSIKCAIAFSRRSSHHTGDTACYDIRDFCFDIVDYDKFQTVSIKDSIIASYYVNDNFELEHWDESKD